VNALASLGGQLYTRLAELLAPADSLLDATSCLMILESAGKDVGGMASLPKAQAIEALAALANSIPATAPTFLDTGNYYDDMWDFILTSATSTSDLGDPANVTFAQLLAKNKFDFEAMALASVDQPATVFHPVQATPSDWLGDIGWNNVSFRIGGDAPPPTPSTPPQLFVPQEIPSLTWRASDETVAHVLEPVDPFHDEMLIPATRPPIVDRSLVDPPPEITLRRAKVALQKPQALRLTSEFRNGEAIILGDELDWRDIWTVSRATDLVARSSDAAPSATGFEISFEYRVVALRRSWLRSQLCSLTGWTIPGLPSLKISNGDPNGNMGLMPLITNRLLVVRDLLVHAHWSDADRAKAEDSDTISFGPFSISGSDGFDGTTMSRPTPQVVAWLATVVPPCPIA
jgi:hypothetical protein